MVSSTIVISVKKILFVCLFDVEMRTKYRIGIARFLRVLLGKVFFLLSMFISYTRGCKLKSEGEKVCV
jgi:hypothetical protein